MVVLTTRNITPIFLKYRNQHKNKKNRFGQSILDPSLHFNHKLYSGEQRLLSAHSDDENAGVEMSTQLPPLWVDIVEETRDEINRIKEKMSQLQRAQQKKLLKVFQNDNAYQTDDEISLLSDGISQLFKQCEQNIKRILPENNSYDGNIISNTDFTLRQNAQKNVVIQLKFLSVAFRKQQKYYLKEMRKRTKGEDTYETSSTQSTADPGFSEDAMAELETLEVDVDSRNEELSRIAQSVADLHTLFKDLSSIVIEQGTILDRIDYNVEQVVQSTKQANVQLLKAEKSMRSPRAEKCIFILIILIFVLLILFLIKHWPF